MKIVTPRNDMNHLQNFITPKVEKIPEQVKQVLKLRSGSVSNRKKFSLVEESPSAILKRNQKFINKIISKNLESNEKTPLEG